MLVPGYGDAVQFMKAGIIELADIFLVNKGDMPGAKELFLQVRAELHQLAAADWNVQVTLTNALNGQGIAEFWRQVEDHETFLKKGGHLQRMEEDRRLSLMQLYLDERWKEFTGRFLPQEHPKVYQAVRQGKLHPLKGAKQLLKNLPGL